MAVSRALRRLLHVLEIEEEQCRLALESALGELRNLERALTATAGQDRGGRELVVASAHSGELPDRLAGLEETHVAKRRASALGPRIVNAKLNTAGLQQEFLGKRVERRQAETLLQAAEARHAVEASRRGQRSLDDWYLNQLHGADGAAESKKRASTGDAPQESDWSNGRT